MASKKKETALVGKKKFSLFNLGKSGTETNVEKQKTSTASAEATANSAVTAAVLHSNDKNRPSTSSKGHIKKITKFFKKSIPNTSVPKKTSKKANTSVDHKKHPVKRSSEPTKNQVVELGPTPVDIQELSGEKNDEVPLKVTAGFTDDELRQKAATKIQAIYKAYIQRRKYKQELHNVIKVEALARGFLARKHVAGMKTSPEVKEEDKTPEENLAENAEQKVDKIQSENLITL